ncbi:MAG: DUF5615 family PIN-like protein [Deltaproteobacteria bacterium]|nr:DUF5615 family PIN-like protein [Deltaproteobacteria bacterium]
MKFLLDQDVYEITARLLRSMGHDVVTAADLGLSRASDLELLAAARERERILVTRDADFGELVFLKESSAGVLYLRMTPASASSVHEELARVLAEHGQTELMKAFVVVEPGRHRYRRLPAHPAGKVQ